MKAVGPTRRYRNENLTIRFRQGSVGTHITRNGQYDVTMTSAEGCSVSKKFKSTLQAHRSADDCLANCLQLCSRWYPRPGLEQHRRTLLRACTGHLTSTLDVVCTLLTQPCWWYRPPDVQHSVTVPSQWLRRVRGTACRRLSGMHRRWRRSVANWRLYFSGRRLTMTGRSWPYCTV